MRPLPLPCRAFGAVLLALAACGRPPQQEPVKLGPDDPSTKAPAPARPAPAGPSRAAGRERPEAGTSEGDDGAEETPADR